MNEQATTKCLFLGNLPNGVTEKGIRELFGDREIESVTIPTKHRGRRTRSFCFVEMASEDGANEALQALQGSTLDGKTLTFGHATKEKSHFTKTRTEDYGSRGGGFRGGGGGGRRN